MPDEFVPKPSWLSLLDKPSQLINLSEIGLEDFGMGVLSVADAAAMLVYIGAASSASLATKADLVSGLVPASQLPSYVDDVLEFAALVNFPATGEAGKIYVATGTGKTYRWSGSAYVELTASTAVWGSISGELLNQTDLQAALDAKASTSHSHSFASLTGIPTTLVGFGITDAQPLDADLTLLASHGYEVAQDVAFAETITWTGTTAPSNPSSLRYSWVRVGKLVTFNIRLVWGTAGSAITNMVFPIPSGMPTPSAMAGEGTSEKSVTLSGQVSSNAARTGVVSAMTARLSRNAGAWEIYAPFGSVNLTYAQISGSYLWQ